MFSPAKASPLRGSLIVNVSLLKIWRHVLSIFSAFVKTLRTSYTRTHIAQNTQPLCLQHAKHYELKQQWLNSLDWFLEKIKWAEVKTESSVKQNPIMFWTDLVSLRLQNWKTPQSALYPETLCLSSYSRQHCIWCCFEWLVFADWLATLICMLWGSREDILVLLLISNMQNLQRQRPGASVS